MVKKTCGCHHNIFFHVDLLYRRGCIIFFFSFSMWMCLGPSVIGFIFFFIGCFFCSFFFKSVVIKFIIIIHLRYITILWECEWVFRLEVPWDLRMRLDVSIGQMIRSFADWVTFDAVLFFIGGRSGGQKNAGMIFPSTARWQTTMNRMKWIHCSCKWPMETSSLHHRWLKIRNYLSILIK